MRLQSDVLTENLSRQGVLIRHAISKRADARSNRRGRASGLSGGNVSPAVVELNLNSRVECRTGTATDATAGLHDGLEQVGCVILSGRHLL
jgi:hypothetical protein